ncbi:hypothetical protein [Demequina litorisediminis]|uniref:Uncharacterized protein n=1 Tax=Demequina litorisediminis TaxID=1849022 RepID=A0ABQ6IBI7_9MICO|nr:hypothetical protein [Demequina litorisediminis]GMA34710.1 hypothetical protein GCM10025876_09140 [Demequina litorisediminis]
MASSACSSLIRFDVHLLGAGPSNIGALYLLPETNEPMFGSFQALRLEPGGRLRRAAATRHRGGTR